MRVDDRRRETQRLLRLKGEVEYSWLAEHFGVSEMTARRDLEDLEVAGEARRVRGGAISVVSRGYEPSLSERSVVNAAAKQAVAERATALVSEGDSIFVDAGTTTLAFAQRLSAAGLGVLAVTPNLQAGLALADGPAARVIIPGGFLRRQEHSLVGPDTDSTMERYNLDTAFIGAAGVDVERGVTDYGVEEAHVKQIALRRAHRVVLLADRSKLGRVSLCAVCALADVDVLVTDADADDPIVQRIADGGTQVLTVDGASVPPTTSEEQEDVAR